MSEPVIVFIKSNGCGHCVNLYKIWDKVVAAMKTVNPKLRFTVVTVVNRGIDENTVPKGLSVYLNWFPKVLLVPGRVWDSAMAKLGPKNDVEIKDGVQICNGYWSGSKVEYKQTYDIRNPDEFARWLKVALEDKDFKRVQNGEGGPHIPTKTTPIQPLMPDIKRPTSFAKYSSTDNNKCSPIRIVQKSRR